MISSNKDQTTERKFAQLIYQHNKLKNELGLEHNKLNNALGHAVVAIDALKQRMDGAVGQLAANTAHHIALSGRVDGQGQEIASILTRMAQLEAQPAAGGAPGAGAPAGVPAPPAVRESAAGRYRVAFYSLAGDHCGTFTLDELTVPQLRDIYNHFIGRVKGTESMQYFHAGYTQAQWLRAPRIEKANGGYLTLKWGMFVTYINRRLAAEGLARVPRP